MECYTCKSNSGEQRISPGPTIYAGKYWLVEHAYPCSTKGWLVLVLMRHIEALHELSTEEFSELARLIEKAAKALHKVLGCQKEYVACFAEAAHFNHIHFHVVARAADLPPELIGPGIFNALKVSEQEAVTPNEITRFCEEVQVHFA